MTNPVVVLETSLGTIRVTLDAERAPISSANFLTYVAGGHYDGTMFHRVIPGFMVQGGGLDAAMRERPTQPPIKNEAGNGLRNVRGAVAMARTSAVDSATSQFFINVVDNAFLDHKAPTPRDFGYAVFGRVSAGMEVVDRIVAVPTGRRGGHDNVPLEPVVLRSATLEAPPADA
jgi:peptidyl-prolyl cis-trans isomerase A (cyclophilin A)